MAGCASPRRWRSANATSTQGAAHCSCATARAVAAARSGWTPGAGNSWVHGSPPALSSRSGRCSASSTARRAGGPGRAPTYALIPPTLRPSGYPVPLRVAPVAPRPCGRARARGRAAQCDPAAARPRQPRHDLDLPSGHRHRRDHRRRPRQARADDVRHRRPAALSNPTPDSGSVASAPAARSSWQPLRIQCDRDQIAPARLTRTRCSSEAVTRCVTGGVIALRRIQSRAGAESDCRAGSAGPTRASDGGKRHTWVIVDFVPIGNRSEGVGQLRARDTWGAMQHVLVEREDELEELDRLLTAALSGSGAVAFIVGEAGVGKTRLVAQAAVRGRELSLEVLRARGGELEQELPFGIVRQLFEPPLASQASAIREELLDGAAKLARPVFDLAGPGEPGRGEDPSFAVLHGLYWLAANLAARRPLVLLIDDAHWVDRASRRWLDYLARRIEAVPLLLVVAMRLGAREARDALDDLMSSASSNVVRPRPLTARGCARVLRSRWRLADDAFCDACHEASGGNPFLLGELVADLAHQRIEPRAENAARVRDIGPGSVSQAVVSRLERLTPSAASVARAVAVLSARADLAAVARLTHLPESEVERARDGLTRAGILAEQRELDFVHPIVRRAIYSSIPPSDRALLHSKAARLLEHAAGSLEEVAAHLLVAEPEGAAWRVAALRGAAARASERGAPDAAVAYLRRALAEPPAGPERAGVLTDLGNAELRAGALVGGDVGWEGESPAVEHLREAVELIEDPRRASRGGAAARRRAVGARPLPRGRRRLRRRGAGRPRARPGARAAARGSRRRRGPADAVCMASRGGTTRSISRGRRCDPGGASRRRGFGGGQGAVRRAAGTTTAPSGPPPVATTHDHHGVIVTSIERPEAELLELPRPLHRPATRPSRQAGLHGARHEARLERRHPLRPGRHRPRGRLAHPVGGSRPGRARRCHRRGGRRRHGRRLLRRHDRDRLAGQGDRGRRSRRRRPRRGRAAGTRVPGVRAGHHAAQLPLPGWCRARSGERARRLRRHTRRARRHRGRRRRRRGRPAQANRS